MNPLDIAFKAGFKKQAFKPMEAKVTDYQSSTESDTSDFSQYNEKPREVQMTNNENQADFSALEDMGMAGLMSMDDEPESPTMKGINETYDFDFEMPGPGGPFN